MRKAVSILTLLITAGLLVTGCGKDRPTSFQDLIFGSWVRQDPSALTRYAEITFTKTSDLVGTFLAFLEGTDPDTGDPVTVQVQGTMAIQGSTLVLIGGAAGDPSATSRFSFSIDADVLTLDPEFGDPELYVKK